MDRLLSDIGLIFERRTLNYNDLKGRNLYDGTQVQVSNSQLIDEDKIQLNNMLNLYDGEDTKRKTHYNILCSNRGTIATNVD